MIAYNISNKFYFVHKSERWNTAGKNVFYAHFFWRKRFFWLILAPEGDLALLFKRNHKFESMGFVSDEAGGNISGHRLVSARGKLTHQHPTYAQTLFWTSVSLSKLWAACF